MEGLVPIYTEEEMANRFYVDNYDQLTEKERVKLRLKYVCPECGEWVNYWLDANGKTYLACHRHNINQHEGVAREYIEPNEKYITARRESMSEQEVKISQALVARGVPLTGALTQPQAMHILKLVYPYVPEDQIIRTAILCRDFGLHPLMKEVYILGFKNKKTGKTDYSTVLGIGASRKMAADKKGAYSFIDASPRTATKEEIVKQYGENSEEERDNLVSICKLKGESGNEAIGFGLWPKLKPKYDADGKMVYSGGEPVLVSNEPYGTEKGNTKRNMANIRSERQALDRLPGEAIPLRHLEVIDEAYSDVPDVGKVSKETGEIIDSEARDVTDEPPAQNDLGICPIHNIPLVPGKGNLPPYCPTRVDGTGRYTGKKVWCKGKPLAAEAAQQEPVGDLFPEEAEQTTAIPEICKGCSMWEECQGSNQEDCEHRGLEPAPNTVAARDPATIQTITDLFKACNQDWKMQPADVVKEAGYNSKEDISERPSDIYRRIKEFKGRGVGR